MCSEGRKSKNDDLRMALGLGVSNNTIAVDHHTQEVAIRSVELGHLCVEPLVSRENPADITPLSLTHSKMKRMNVGFRTP